MSDNKNKVVKTVDHPLEEFFDIEEGTTEIEVFEREGELVKDEGYDDKDTEIETQFQEVYDSAMDGHDTLSVELRNVEGKYKARVGEVAVQHLNAALNAAQAKAKLKEHKDKLEVKEANPASKVVNNNLIVDDRSLFLQKLRESMEGKDDE